jgi:hypothetical protein
VELFPHRETPIAATVFLALTGDVGCQDKKVPRFLVELSQM